MLLTARRTRGNLTETYSAECENKDDLHELADIREAEGWTVSRCWHQAEEIFLLRAAVDQVLKIGFADDDPEVRLMLRACRRAVGKEVVTG